MTRPILALDLGQKTGWAARIESGARSSGVVEFRPGRFEGGGMVWLRFHEWLDWIALNVGLVRGAPGSDRRGIILFEEVRAHRGTAAAHCYGGFLAHLTAFCETVDLPYQGVPVGTIKRHITGKGNASKEAVLEAVRRLGFNPIDDNEADALALLQWGIKEHG